MLNNVNIKKLSLWLTIGALSCFAIAVILFFQIDLKDLQNNKYQYDVNEHKSFVHEEIKDINVKSFSSDVKIIETDDTQVKVHIYGKLYNRSKINGPVPIIELSNGKLTIDENRKSSTNIGINLNIGDLFQKNEMEIDLYLPKSYSENINVDSFSGNVESDTFSLKDVYIKTFSSDLKLEDLAADTISFETSSGYIDAGNIKSKDLKVKTFSGDIRIKSMNAAKINFKSSSGHAELGSVQSEEITGSTFSGDITANDINTGNLDLHSSSGHIKAGKLSAKNIKCKTFSGDVRFSNSSIYGSEIETSSGTVTLGLSEDSEFTLSAESSSAEVTCQFPINITGKKGEHDLFGTVGSGTSKINIKTFSGDIKIIK